MFNDFDGHEEEDDGKGRRVASLGISALIYGGLAILAATAVTAAGAAVVERRVEVTFAPPPPMPEMEAPEPEPEPEQPQVRRAGNNRPRAARSPETPPSHIPDGQLAESEGELGEAGETGVVEGYVDGDGEGTGEVAPMPEVAVEEVGPPQAPEGQVRETVSRPRFVGGCRAPIPPDSLRTQAQTIRITVRVLVDPEGHPSNATVTEGNPLIPDQLIIDCAMQQQFAAATLPDGTPVPYPYMRRFVFRPSNL